MRSLSSQVDAVEQTEQVQNELRFITSLLEQIAKEEREGKQEPRAQSWTVWPVSGLEVVATRSKRRRSKDAIDRVLFHRLIHDIRSGARNGRPGDVAVVAGADRIGLESLENLAREARSTGTRLVLLFEHLRDDLQRFLGGSDSASIIMRLGNAQEAAAAGEFIGRGHTFVLSQLTRQYGETVTRGTVESRGSQESKSTSDTHSAARSAGPRLLSASSTSGRSVSLTESWSFSKQHTASESTADSATEVTTESRVYEFTVEPTEIQGLPPTAFVLVESKPSGRQVVTGDSNPGVTLMERVSSEPLGSPRMQPPKR